MNTKSDKSSKEKLATHQASGLSHLAESAEPTNGTRKVRKIMDDKYEIVKTIGEGRYAK